MSDILALKRMLADRAEEIAQKLFPNGRRHGHEWRVGSTQGERGESLGVHLMGAKAGVWADFNSGETGDLIDLWMAVHSCDLVRALDEIRSYLGVTRPEPYRDPRPAYARPPKPRCVAPVARVLDYLTVERNVPRAVLEKYRVGEDGTRIIFPFLLPDGTLAMAKAREAVDGAKPVPTAANCEPILFGWQAIDPNERTLVITEGEIDALSMAAYGLPAVSVPYGGGGKGKQNWIENEFDRLERFERIYLATDMDEPGEQAAAEIASRLGRHRCYRVKLPRKDANECLNDGVPDEEIARCIETAQSLDPDGIKRPVDFRDQLKARFRPGQESGRGYSMPYRGLRGQIGFRPGEATIWSGPSGAGKSLFLNDNIPCWIKEGSRICLASFEMAALENLVRLVRQTGGVKVPTDAFSDEILTWLDTGLLLYDKVGKCGVGDLLQVFDYVRAKYGCDQFIVDSLMRLGIPSDDYVGQEQAVFKLVDWAISNAVHVHLVVHSRKGAHGAGPPETEDIKGASEIGANAFNIVTIWRNRKVEPDGGDPDGRPEFTENPGITINVAKQRNGNFEGKLKFYFSTRTQQYFSVLDDRRFPRCYVEVQQEMKSA